VNDVSSHTAIAETDWSADELIPFGKYILLDRINSGATAAVYRANVRGEAGFERLVAIKRILPHMAGDRDFVDTFVREAKTVARLAHAGICPIYELGKVGESLYMAVEYIQGKDLGLIMRRLARRNQAMPPLIAAWIAARLCDALDYAHNLKNSKGVRTGMIHRDLSPSNILVSFEGQVKIIDFGLARAVGRAQSTNVDALKKKLSYMSPEMVKGRQLDARSDIFGVGICLYEMVTARRLFAATNDIETLKLVSKAAVPPPSAVIDDAPDELEIVIMHSLEREPEDRFQTAADMGEALNAFIQKIEPSYSPQRLADWMQELFGNDIEEEQKRIKVLLQASADPDLIKERRMFFASATGAAARARAEIERRLSTEPPPAQMPRHPSIPSLAPLPRDATPQVPTAYYDAEKTVAAHSAAVAEAFENEPTSFYDDERTQAVASEQSEPTSPTPFEDEPTQYLEDKELEDVVEATGGFDEEPTEIFFNKEEGVGIQELLDEINDVEAPGPLNKPIVAPELALPVAPPPASLRPPVRSSMRPVAPTSIPARRAPSVYPPQQQATLEIAPARQPSIWPVALGGAAMLAAIFVLIAKTPAGVALGLRPPPPGAIEIRTNPAVQADVRLDDIYRGRAPLRLEGVRPGARRLEVRAEGYLPVTREVQLEGGSAALVDISLVEDRPKPAPAPAPAPTTPTAPAGTPPSGTSEHSQPSVNHHHHESSSRHADAPAPPPVPNTTAAPESAPVRPATPAPAPGTPGSLAINTVPWSLVFIDGRDTGRSTPLLGYPIAPGPHEIRLQTGTGGVYIERIMVQPGQAVRITRRF
jgi:serine/threonine protein kinase